MAILLLGMVPVGAAAATSQLACTPPNLRFGAIVVGQTETLLVTVTNTGQTSATVSAIAMGNSQFTTSPLSLPLVLPAGQSVSLSVTFAPTTTGWTGGTIKFFGNALTLNLNVGGTGLSSEPVAASPSIASSGQVMTVAASAKSAPDVAITTSTLPNGTVQTAYTATVETSGGCTPMKWTASGLPSGVTSAPTNNTEYLALSGTPTTAGSYSPAISVKGCGGHVSSKQYSMTIQAAQAPAPVITSASTASGTVGSAFSYQITATNSPTSYGAAGLPAGLSVSSTSGLISGTPTTAGTSTVTLGASNSGGTGNATLALTIKPNCASPESIGTFVICSSIIGANESSLVSTVSASSSPAAGNGVLIVGQYCPSNDLCNGTPTQTAVINTNIYPYSSYPAGDPNFFKSPRSPLISADAVVNDQIAEYVWYAPVIEAGVTSFTMTMSSPGWYPQIDVIEFQVGSIATTGYFDLGSLGTGAENVNYGTGIGTTSSISTNGSTVNANDLILGFIDTCGGNVPNYPGPGFTGILVNSVVTGHVAEGEAVSSTGSYAATSYWTTSPTSLCGGGTGGNDSWYGIVVPLVGASQPIKPAPPVITSATTASGTVGSAFSYQITATNTPSSYGAAGLPGLSVSSTSGLISGTPTTAGTSTVTLGASNSGGTGNATLALTINQAAPVITSAKAASGTVGSAFSYQITATNTPTSYGATGLPAGLSLNSSTGLISGTPTVTATSTVTLSATDSGGTGSTTLTLTINPAPVAAGQLTSNPASLAFGSAQVGSSLTLTDSLTNTGGSSVTISQATATGTGFSISGLNVPLVLNPGASVTFSALFAPLSAVSASGGITVASNASNPSLTVSLSGTGTAPGQITLAPTALSFGNTTVGTGVSQASSLSAAGASVTVSSASLSSAEFSLTGISLPITLAAGQSVPVTVTFTPQSSGSVSGVLTVAGNASNTATQSLSGVGVAATQHSVTLSWTDTDSGIAGYNVYRGNSAGGPFTQINSGLDAAPAYSDTSVAAGQTYYYVTTAVNESGAESAYSNEVQAVVPSP
jgi:hypothetical protein